MIFQKWFGIGIVGIIFHAYSLCCTSIILELLNITQSEQSHDYVVNKKQFQLHELLTEQRHPATLNLSHTIKEDTLSGIKSLLLVDLDISEKFLEISKDTALLEQAAHAVENAILENKKIYIYGCGATGRLAKQMESSFWRPFWKKMKSLAQWEIIKYYFPTIEDALIGEMTGADRALISSLEGFEDLQLIGNLQLEDHHIQKGDVVFAITEGGETSSVIGTILAVLNHYDVNMPTDINEAQKHLYFMYNNPDEVLIPLERSRTVIAADAITKIPLFTGPQAITGSTRMQATTSETFIMGIILEHAIENLLKQYLSQEQLKAIGFNETTMREKLLSFFPIQTAVYYSKNYISHFTDLEACTYATGRGATYFAKDALLTVFIDSTERAPTFRLFPLDSVNEFPRKSWIQVWTPARDTVDAWKNILGRSFRGLKQDDYEGHFLSSISDPFLQKVALSSLKNAGDDQQYMYDFSFSSSTVENRGPKEDDLGVMILLADEIDELLHGTSDWCLWLKLFSENKAKVVVILLPCDYLSSENPVLKTITSLAPNAFILQLPLKNNQDPLCLRHHIGLKMLLNAHSTGVMAKLGRVVGNTMTNVNPGNLKLIGRATYLILSHVNDLVCESDKISYNDANAVLFDAIEYIKNNNKVGQNSEVALSIIRILEALKIKRCVSWEEAEKILENRGLENYLLADKTHLLHKNPVA
jgi:N-acetylmuramic acid 6-phosphate etherase